MVQEGMCYVPRTCELHWLLSPMPEHLLYRLANRHTKGKDSMPIPHRFAAARGQYLIWWRQMWIRVLAKPTTCRQLQRRESIQRTTKVTRANRKLLLRRDRSAYDSEINRTKFTLASLPALFHHAF